MNHPGEPRCAVRNAARERWAGAATLKTCSAAAELRGRAPCYARLRATPRSGFPRPPAPLWRARREGNLGGLRLGVPRAVSPSAQPSRGVWREEARACALGPPGWHFARGPRSTAGGPHPAGAFDCHRLMKQRFSWSLLKYP